MPEESFCRSRTFTTSDGVQIHYEDQGKGPALLLVPGWSMSTRFWRGQIEALSPHNRVIAVDLRCHGQSAKPMYGLRVARLATDISELIDHLRLADVHGVGWSMGASILWSLIDLHGSRRFRTFTFVDQPPKLLNDRDWVHAPFGVTRATLDEMANAIRADQTGFLGQFVPNMFASPPAEHDVAWMIEECLKCPPEQAAAILVDHCNQDWRDVVRRADRPVLFIAGARSVSKAGVDAVVSGVPDCSYRVFERSSHLPFIEEAAHFNATLRDFISAA